MLKSVVKTYVLQGSSLLNAVTVSLIVALFCTSLIALWYSNELMVSKFKNSLDLIEENKFTAQLIVSDNKYLDLFPQEVVSDNREFTSKYKLRPWGIFKTLTVTTFSASDSISKSFLLGNTAIDKPNRDLYLLETGKNLKYAGSVTFSQDITIPNARAVSHFLPKIRNKIIQKGKINSSSKKLPKVQWENYNHPKEDYQTITIEEVLDNEGVLTNSFNEPTIHLTISGNYTLRNVVIKGNIVIVSNARLNVHSTAHLNDVIIESPEVIFLNNFKGNVQVHSKKKIELANHSVLEYPSAIYAQNKNDSIHIKIGEHSSLYGSLILDNLSTAFVYKRKLTVAKSATVIGDVYCNGVAEIKGTIYGSSIINRFLYKTQTTTVDNLVVDATFNSKKIPKGYCRIASGTNVKSSYDVIKEF